jgi:thiamine-monophosphate kinase
MKEFELIKKIGAGLIADKRFIKKGIGDDCAVLKYSDKFDLLVTTDMLVEDIHFKLNWYSPQSFAKKILYSNISDINSCGGKPFALTVSAGISKKMNVKFLNKFIQYLKIESRKFNCDLIGGDTVSADKNTLSVTMFGFVKKDKAILRSCAKAGDKVYITGYPGLSDAGLYLLKNKINTDKKYKKILIQKHLIPSIIKDDKLLNEIFKITNSMIDVSDGLSSELNHIANQSKKKIIIEKDLIPLNKDLILFCNEYKIDLFKTIFRGGEDFYLLFTTAQNINIKNTFQIGFVEKGRGVFLKDKTDLIKIKSSGWEHNLIK